MFFAWQNQLTFSISADDRITLTGLGRVNDELETIHKNDLQQKHQSLHRRENI